MLYTLPVRGFNAVAAQCISNIDQSRWHCTDDSHFQVDKWQLIGIMAIVKIMV